MLEAGGDYVLLVKENQPTLYNDIRLLFNPPPNLAARPWKTSGRRRRASAGTGGRTRPHLVASTDLNDYTAWPGMAQVFRLTRTWREHGETKRALHDELTSLAPEAGPPERLLALKRGHWVIDVTFDEDRSPVRCGAIPEVMAAFRTTAIGLLRVAGETNIAAACRRCAAQPWRALALIGIVRE